MKAIKTRPKGTTTPKNGQNQAGITGHIDRLRKEAAGKYLLIDISRLLSESPAPVPSWLREDLMSLLGNTQDESLRHDSEQGADDTRSARLKNPSHAVQFPGNEGCTTWQFDSPELAVQLCGLSGPLNTKALSPLEARLNALAYLQLAYLPPEPDPILLAPEAAASPLLPNRHQKIGLLRRLWRRLTRRGQCPINSRLTCGDEIGGVAINQSASTQGNPEGGAQ